MPVSLFIQDNYIDDLIEFYTLKLKAVKQKKIDADTEESAVKATLAQLKAKKYESAVSNVNLMMPVKLSDTDYKSSWIWTKKIEFVIREAGKPMSTSEIVERLLDYEPLLERKKAIASVSSMLSTKSGDIEDDDKEFIKIDDGTSRSKFYIKGNDTGHVPVTLPVLIDKVLNPNNEVDDLPF